MPVLFLIIFRRSGAYGSNLVQQRGGAFSPITADMVGALADKTVPITKGGTGATTAVNAYNNLVYRGSVVSSTNWNDLSVGVYKVENGTIGPNGPVNLYSYGFVIVPSKQIQIYIAHHGGAATRLNFDSIWTSWNYIWATGDNTSAGHTTMQNQATAAPSTWTKNGIWIQRV